MATMLKLVYLFLKLLLFSVSTIKGVTEDDISFFIHNNADRTPTEVLLAEASNITLVSQFDPSLRTIFLIHGWIANHSSEFNVHVGDSYLNVSDVNIVDLDWDDISSSDYLTTYMSVPSIGQYVGQFIQNISLSYNYSLDNVSLVGHSLGAHISGFAGQYTNGTVSSIIGLDPAGPLYFEFLPNDRLSKGDAQYVQAIHTNTALYGISYNVGDADFRPNGGALQPGCDVLTDIADFCSHLKSYDYFAASLLSTDFFSRQCDNYNDYLRGACASNPWAIMGGASVNSSIVGSYYLQTSSEFPYAKGPTTL